MLIYLNSVNKNSPGFWFNVFVMYISQSPNHITWPSTFQIAHPSITVTSQWTRWRLKSPAPWLFTQPTGQAQITIVYSTVYSGADKKKKHQSYASLAFVRWIHRWPVNSPHEWPVTRKIFPFDDVIMHSDETDGLWKPLLLNDNRFYYWPL